MSIYSLTPEDEPLFESLKHVHVDTDYDIVDQCGERNIMYGKKHSEATKQAMSEALKLIPHIIGRPGKLNGMYGKTHTDEVKKKLSDGVRARNLSRGKEATAAMNKVKECPHCGKSVTTGNYSRWHGINCKEYIQPEPSNLC